MARHGFLSSLVSVLVTVELCDWGTLALTLTPRISLRQLPVCLPDPIPNLVLPDDFLTCAAAVRESRTWHHPDQDKTTDKIVTSYGYSLKVYNVTTYDGYILTVHRITGGPKSPPRPGKRSVYLNHGLGGASDSWLIQYGDRNLAFKLVDAGFDVWLGNCRGSTYSLLHETLTAQTDWQYWDFSWHEMALGDVPAVVDKIISESGNAKISYIGYSMGTTQYFIATSMIPELNKRIDVGILLSAVAYNGHANNPLRLVAPLTLTGAQDLVSHLVMGRLDFPEFFETYTDISSLGDVCAPTTIRCGLCDNFYYFLFGFDATQQNYTNMPFILSKFPHNISLKSMVHYTQGMNSCEFRQFDYGLIENRLRYGSDDPPKYDLRQITAPTHMFYADSDNLAVPTDVFMTRDSMNPSAVKGMYRVNLEQFNHMDFQFAKDADILVYNKVVEILKPA